MLPPRLPLPLPLVLAPGVVRSAPGRAVTVLGREVVVPEPGRAVTVLWRALDERVVT